MGLVFSQVQPQSSAVSEQSVRLIRSKVAGLPKVRDAGFTYVFWESINEAIEFVLDCHRDTGAIERASSTKDFFPYLQCAI
ncbi:unnamed protein product [Protopolystoma xenopodis]|uniref:Uncharacterized protein n=1 Tax=Protopolystoma xenopodis TaxID=117903 RepID=A0A3S5CU66_9PLAT|nr:unnamed protein product [Protopolystoma xenopodis]